MSKPVSRVKVSSAAASRHARPSQPIWWIALLLPIVLSHSADAGSLSSIAPTGVSAGQAVTITGTGFDAAAASNAVTFTPLSGPAVTVDATSVATVDADARVRRLSVTVPNTLPVGPVTVRVLSRGTGEVTDVRTLDILSIDLPDV